MKYNEIKQIASKIASQQLHVFAGRGMYFSETEVNAFAKPIEELMLVLESMVSAVDHQNRGFTLREISAAYNQNVCSIIQEVSGHIKEYHDDK